MTPHRQHADMAGIYINRRTQKLLAIALCVVIGVALAVWLFFGLSK